MASSCSRHLVQDIQVALRGSVGKGKNLLLK
jgi:hypothetical protein